MRLPKAKICLEDSSKITTLLDTDAEINVMIRELMKNINLAMKQGFKLELVFHTSYSCFFLCFCENVKVVIGKFKTKHPIFVVEANNHNLILGQTFLNFIKFSQKYKPDKIFGTIIYSHID